MLQSWPKFEPEDIEKVGKVLASGKINYWTGTKVKEFEQEFAVFSDTKYAIALANGSVALELALYALDIQKGDEVIVTCRSFIASVSSIILRGATPVFVDVEPDSQNISINTIREKITSRTKAIICVHLNGWPCDMDPILEFAKDNHIYVIEDCAQAHGAKYKNRPVGGLGDIGCWSFCQDKIITTGGEGGMITLNDDELYKRAWSYKDHGKDYDRIFNQPRSPIYEPLYTSIGTNWRMTEIQAVLGLNMLHRLDWFHQQREYFYDLYCKELRDIIGIDIPTIPKNITHAHYKFYLFLKDNNRTLRNTLLAYLTDQQIPISCGACGELYLEPCLKDYAPEERLQTAELLNNTSLMLPLHPYMNDLEIKSVCTIIKKAVKQYLV